MWNVTKRKIGICTRNQHYFISGDISPTSKSRAGYIVIWKQREDTWKGFVLFHRPVRVFRCQREVPFAVDLPSGRVLSSSLPLCSGSVSTWFKAKMVHGSEFTSPCTQRKKLLKTPKCIMQIEPMFESYGLKITSICTTIVWQRWFISNLWKSSSQKTSI